MPRGRLTQLRHRYGIPKAGSPPIQWTATAGGSKRTNHVDAGDDGSIPEAEALAFAMGVEKHANAHPACADSYSFNSKNACFQARSHPRPPATVAGLNQTNGTRHARPFPSFPRRQSRHCWPLRGLLYCLESRPPSPAALCCSAGGPQSPLKETHHEADADQRHAARRTPPGHR